MVDGKLEIYCPLCTCRFGKKRSYLLARVDRNATGKLYLYCKHCKQEHEINIDNSAEEPSR